MGTEAWLEYLQGEGGDTEIVSIGSHLKNRNSMAIRGGMLG